SNFSAIVGAAPAPVAGASAAAVAGSAAASAVFAVAVVAAGALLAAVVFAVVVSFAWPKPPARARVTPATNAVMLTRFSMRISFRLLQPSRPRRYFFRRDRADRPAMDFRRTRLLQIQGAGTSTGARAAPGAAVHRRPPTGRVSGPHRSSA